MCPDALFDFGKQKKNPHFLQYYTLINYVLKIQKTKIMNKIDVILDMTDAKIWWIHRFFCSVGSSTAIRYFIMNQKKTQYDICFVNISQKTPSKLIVFPNPYFILIFFFCLTMP